MLYTHYFYLFQAAGLILLVAMIGAIVLTLRQRAGRAPPDDRRPARPRRREAIAVEIKNVPTRQGACDA